MERVNPVQLKFKILKTKMSPAWESENYLLVENLLHLRFPFLNSEKYNVEDWSDGVNYGL